MQLHATDLRKGTLVSYQGRACTVVHWNVLRNDRRTFVQLKLKDLATGRLTELKEHTDTRFEVLESEILDLAYSYRDGQDEVFYTPGGEEHRVPAALAADALRWEADVYKGLVVDGRLVGLSPPSSVVLEVSETAPPMKGAGSGLKDAVLSNGVKVRVGFQVAVGDRVRVDPDTLEFKERA